MTQFIAQGNLAGIVNVVFSFVVPRGSGDESESRHIFCSEQFSYS